MLATHGRACSRRWCSCLKMLPPISVLWDIARADLKSKDTKSRCYFFGGFALLTLVSLFGCVVAVVALVHSR
jgi:hypothetical protein